MNHVANILGFGSNVIQKFMKLILKEICIVVKKVHCKQIFCIVRFLNVVFCLAVFVVINSSVTCLLLSITFQYCLVAV